jgi:hypothetical protein
MYVCMDLYEDESEIGYFLSKLEIFLVGQDIFDYHELTKLYTASAFLILYFSQWNFHIDYLKLSLLFVNTGYTVYFRQEF